MKFTLVTVIFMLSLNALAIVDGTPITGPEFRQTVAITYKADPYQTESEIYCSGTLIGPRMVITAAHCFMSGAKAHKLSLDEFKQATWVYFGETTNARDLPMISAQIKAKRVELKSLSDAVSGDVALIELAQEVDLAKWKITPTKFMVPTAKMKGQELIHVGYGQITNGGVKGNKAYLKLPITEVNEYNGLGVGKMYTEGPSACHGDSGGSGFMTGPDGKLVFVGVGNSISNHPCGKSATFLVPLTDRLIEWIKSFGTTF